MNYRMIIYTLGWVLNIDAMCMILPCICGLLYKETATVWFAVAAAICAAVGFLCTFRQPKNKKMHAKDGLIIVAMSWIVISLFSSLPFLFSKTIPNFVDALFETVSGFTTTGATIINDVDAVPKCMLLWRSFTHWIGGMGVLVFLMSIVPLSGGNNLHMMRAESPGPSVSKIVPKVKSTAKILYLIYAVLTVVQIIFMLFGGVSLFEAITLSFATAGTGGFAVKSSGTMEYSSYIQIVLGVFMVLYGINFSIYYCILTKRFKDVIHSDELKVYLGIILTATIIITVNTFGMTKGIADALKHAFFQVAAIITTTGFSSVDFDLWPEFSKIILVLLMFIGACAGSTGGGIKVSRILILFKSIVKELKILVHPKSTHKITMDKKLVEHETLRSINVYMAAYAAIFVASILIVSLDKFDFTTNFTAVTTAINNVGPGLAAVGPTKTFSEYSMLSKIVFIFDMLVGRLEVFPILALISPYTWKN